ncbi:hypothetical protein D1B31_12315 [Neobacillus notoginsengisoli]|uniref:Uncharacterized protein n=1 Tax=Neobacillus notoginsengisoli TaxID=1578198 RepID=A0A417YTH4_9BACI|nr:hypothetical protein D1B31_12315 [Neobacillus notoginsengisoli]
MTQSQLQSAERLDKRYEQFLYFVLLTLLIQAYPLFERVISNKFILLLSILSIFLLVSKYIGKGTLPKLLRKMCEQLKINLVLLYLVYTAGLFVLVVYIF